MQQNILRKVYLCTFQKNLCDVKKLIALASIIKILTQLQNLTVTINSSLINEYHNLLFILDLMPDDFEGLVHLKTWATMRYGLLVYLFYYNRTRNLNNALENNFEHFFPKYDDST